MLKLSIPTSLCFRRIAPSGWIRAAHRAKHARMAGRGARANHAGGGAIPLARGMPKAAREDGMEGRRMHARNAVHGRCSSFPPVFLGKYTMRYERHAGMGSIGAVIGLSCCLMTFCACEQTSVTRGVGVCGRERTDFMLSLWSTAQRSIHAHKLCMLDRRGPCVALCVMRVL